MQRSVLGAFAAAMLATSAAAPAQDVPRVFDNGPVVVVSYVKVEPGQLYAYMQNLDNLWRRSLEDEKRRGEVLSYGVYEVMSPNPGGHDLELVIEYKNAAVMDISLDELDKRTAAMQGSVGAAETATVERGKLRTIMGSTMLRELKFKTPARR